MAEDWRAAFLLQARSDYAVLRLLLDAARNDPTLLCQCLHYLQMTTEKLAKGFLTEPGGPRPPTVHRAFTRFVQTSRGNDRLRRGCGSTSARQFTAYLNSLLPLASAIEDLAPSGDRDRPNPEYQWEENGAVTAPAEFVFVGLDFKNPKMIKMLQFIENCFRIV